MDYNKILSDKVKNMKPSGIRKFFDIASEMENVISLGVGEPDFKTPYSIRRTAIETLEKGRTKYSANAGLIELRQEIANFLHRKYNINYDYKDGILVTVGGSEAIDLAIRALINPGDEVLIPEPSFVCYTPMVELAHGVPVAIKTALENEFRLTKKDLLEHITDKTKVLILPFPNNPTGSIMKKEHLEEIAEVLRQRDIIVISDEIYSELTYGQKHVSIASIDGMWERTIVINGFSKAYSMTGWRLGYCAGPVPLVSQMTKIHQFAIMCAPTTSQYAAVEALRNGDESINTMVSEYDVRRRLVVDSFNKLGLHCFEPKGAFYVFPCIKSTGMTSEEFCEKLLYSQKVAVVPGNAFGDSGEGFIRVSYSYSVKHLLEAIRRIEIFIKENKVK